ncbi:Chemotaxis response regulator protein-glutamate methylesterase CheB [Candidatus Burkholderia brachyanthoides]|nr:Chemotaxis response regulator protein-glutamate methylesterase CheB [Candidatus Burkholderia brachyanthoides]
MNVPFEPDREQAREFEHFGAIVIGASAGGVETLTHLLPALRRDVAPPVLIVVHVRHGQLSLLPTLFAERCVLDVVEPFDKDTIAPGTAYFAPPGYHMLVETEEDAAPAIALSVDPPVRFSRSSLDVLFESAEHAYGERLLGIVLSGANEDGARGARAICDAGGACWVQDPHSAYATAMPLAAIGECARHDVLTLDDMAMRMSRCICRNE